MVRRAVLCCVMVLALAGRARAEEPFKSDVEFKPKRPDETFHLQLEDADLADVVHTISGVTGKRFVFGANKLKSMKMTVIAPQPVTVAEAYQAFLAALHASGLTVLPKGNFLQIVESQDAMRQNTPLVDNVPADERYITKVHRLANVRAEDVAQNLLAKFQTRDGAIVPYAPGNLLIITDTGANIQRMMRLLEVVDVPGTADDKLYFQPLHYASASDVEKKLSELFDLKKKDGAGDAALHVTRLVPIDRPNALAIVATAESYARLLEMIKLLDQPLSNEGQINVVPLQHADAKKLVGPLNEALAGPSAPATPQTSGAAPRAPLTVLEASVKISAEETTNSILVTSSPRDFAAIKAVIDRLDQPKRQVYIEAVVMEISADRGFDLGMAWHGGALEGDGAFAFGGFRAAASALPPDAGSLQAFALGIRSPEIELPFAIPVGTSSITSIPSLGAFLTAAATTQGADILSTPSLVASDNTPAELKVQLNTPLNPNAPAAPIIASGTTLPSSGTGTANLQKIGPRIKITPHLNESDEVRLDVDEQISDIQSVPEKSNTYGSVTFIERSATTTLTVKDEETVVIAGLMRNRVARSETKVPVLGDIPLLGALFRNSSEQVQKSNLVLVLTPHIIRDRADRLRIFQRKMEEREEMVSHSALFERNNWDPPRDYAHTVGILGEIRKHYADAASKRTLAALREERETKTHEPAEPMELPTPVQTWGAPAPSPAPATPAKPARIEQ